MQDLENQNLSQQPIYVLLKNDHKRNRQTNLIEGVIDRWARLGMVGPHVSANGTCNLFTPLAKQWSNPIGSVCMPYMVSFTITYTPFMLASIYHTYGSYGFGLVFHYRDPSSHLQIGSSGLQWPPRPKFWGGFGRRYELPSAPLGVN